jgi:hypothetical protein
MHVLPLPFGLALALLPRREANKLRDQEPVRVPFEKIVSVREQVVSQYFNAGRYIL